MNILNRVFLQGTHNVHHITRFDLITNCKEAYRACEKACGSKLTKPGREACDHATGICMCDERFYPNKSCRKPFYPRELDFCNDSLCVQNIANHLRNDHNETTMTVPSKRKAFVCWNKQNSIIYCSCFIFDSTG